MTHAYAGIGSRKTPPHVCEFMADVAEVLARKGYALRTGAAHGADEAFEDGARRLERLAPTAQAVEVYLPWHRYNGRRLARLYGPTDEAYEHAARYHPAWERCSHEAQALHARNSHIICGPTLRRPVKFVLCWTPGRTLDGSSPRDGGTGQALRIAAAYGVPVFNLARDEHMDRVGALLGERYIAPRLFA